MDTQGILVHLLLLVPLSLLSQLLLFKPRPFLDREFLPLLCASPPLPQTDSVSSQPTSPPAGVIQLLWLRIARWYGFALIMC